jgi:putative transcriptional regulator
MSFKELHRPGIVAVALLALLLTVGLPVPTAAPQRGSLAGQLLIASPSMGDPRFYQTVVVLVRHDQTGAMGIVINRPLRERPLADILAALGEDAHGAEGSLRIFAGGPVQPELGFVLHSADYFRTGTMRIDGHLALTASREILRDIAGQQGPRQSLVAFGYAGWGPGQLEGELEQRVWFTAPADVKLVFEENRERLWESAVARRTQDL